MKSHLIPLTVAALMAYAASASTAKPAAPGSGTAVGGIVNDPARLVRLLAFAYAGYLLSQKLLKD